MELCVAVSAGEPFCDVEWHAAQVMAAAKMSWERAVDGACRITEKGFLFPVERLLASLDSPVANPMIRQPELIWQCSVPFWYLAKIPVFTPPPLIPVPMSRSPLRLLFRMLLPVLLLASCGVAQQPYHGFQDQNSLD